MTTDTTEIAAPQDEVCARFCAQYREDVGGDDMLCSVCVRDGWLYGTDTHAICGRLTHEGDPERFPTDDVCPNGPPRAGTILKYNWQLCDKTLMPEAVDVCDACDGSGGGLKAVTCATCDGQRMRECCACGHEYECDACDGSGMLDTWHDCEKCGGAGSIIDERGMEVEMQYGEISGRIPLCHYIALVQVPGVRYCMDRIDDQTRILFTGDGGYVGIILCIREEKA